MTNNKHAELIKRLHTAAYNDEHADIVADLLEAADALRASESAAVPVAAWRAPNHSGSGDKWAYRDADDRFENVRGEPCGEPLYLGPAVPNRSLAECRVEKLSAKPLPLTLESRRGMWIATTIEICSHEACYMRGIEDCETAHGITQEPTK